MYPAELKYTRNHEYLRLLGDGTALVGISGYAQEVLGDIVFVALPLQGTHFGTGEEFGTVESVKTVSELYMPATGEVLEINGELEAHPELVNQDPYGEGWMIKVRLDGEPAADLLDAGAYQTLVATETHGQ
nr:glycine cleavage system protein GcvH [uncultured Holophaga sp.]